MGRLYIWNHKKGGKPVTEEDFVSRVTAMRRQLYHVARTMLYREEDAADAVQEAMLRAWSRLPALRDEGQFEAWFFRIFVSRCRDAQRRQIREKQGLKAVADLPPILREEDGRDVRMALMELPEALRLPTVLHYIEGYTLRETAQILALTPEQVNSRVRQARRRMKDLLSEGGI